jgi:hypothetical protein
MKLLALALIAVVASGCGDLSYHANAPNVRTFSEDPSLRQYYIGWDVEFAVVDDPADPDASDEVREPQAPQDEDQLPRDLPGPSFLD